MAAPLLLYVSPVMSRKRGATSVEYVILAGAVALGVMGAFFTFNDSVNKKVKCLGDKVVGNGQGGACKSEDAALGKGAADTNKTKPNSPTAPEANPVAAFSPDDMPGGNGCTGKTCNAPGRCFAAGTMVRTATGMRAIETFHDGEQVLAGNDETMQASTMAIEKVVVTENQEILELTVDADGTNETLKPTLKHAFWVNGEWVQAKDLKEGDIIATNGASKARVAAVKQTGEKTTVYNLEVKDLHTYYVGKTGLFSHNACERVPPTKHLRELATTGELWEKPRFDAVNKLAACRDLTAGDYKILADAVRGEQTAKDGYKTAMGASSTSSTSEGQGAIQEALGRPWFDRAEQALRAASQEGDKNAQEQLTSLGLN